MRAFLAEDARKAPRGQPAKSSTYLPGVPRRIDASPDLHDDNLHPFLDLTRRTLDVPLAWLLPAGADDEPSVRALCERAGEGLVEDARTVPGLAELEAVKQAPHLRFVGVQALERGLGWLCVASPDPRPAAPGDADALARLAAVGAALVQAAHDARELHGLRISEDRYRDLFENSPDLILTVAPNGRILYANRTWCQTLGFRKDEIESLAITDVIHVDGHDRWRETVARVLAGESVELVDVTVVARDGRQIVLEGNVSGKFEEGRPLFTRAVFRDVTDRRAVDRLKDEFVSIVSHELRTPLTSIRGSLGLLAEGVLGQLPEKAQRMIDIAVSNTDRLVRLINDILDIERIESGKIAMEKTDCSALELVRHAIDVMQPMAEKNDVVLVMSGDEVRVHADPDRIHQTLTNLVSNAIKFSPPGGIVEVAVRLDRTSALFSVRDEGRGVPRSFRDKIFERFAQVDASDSRDKGGTGLGLPICRSIVLQHGGSIWVDSNVGRGAVFYFTLEAVRASDKLPDEPEQPLVMVCDDDRDVRRMLSVMLRHRRFRVCAVAGGEELLAKAGEMRPDVILLDLIMPGMTGEEALVALRQTPETARIPVVIVSGLATDTSKAQQMGVSDWVEKPFDERHLMRAIQRALDVSDRPLRALVVEDDPDLGIVLVTILDRKGLDTYHARTGGEAVQLSQKLLPDIIVLDLGLPDVDGASVVGWLRRHNRLARTPMIIYSARDLSEIDRESLQLGPTRFFTKSRVTPAEFEKQISELIEQLPASAEARAAAAATGGPRP